MLTISLQQINKLNKLQGSFEASFFKAGANIFKAKARPMVFKAKSTE